MRRPGRAAATLAVSALLLAAGCGGPGVPPPEPATHDAPATLARCLGTPFAPAPGEAWRHPLASPLTVALGAPGHSIQDVLATPAGAATVHGKFAYGTVSKDLEDERVRVSLDVCSGWVTLGDALTDADGRVAVSLPDGLGPGVYDVRMQVLGDGTLAAGQAWLLPAGTHLAVTDIDGTLTTGDEELVEDVLTDLFQPILGGSYTPAAFPGAAALTGALARRGQVVVYLTGRPYWLTGATRRWLADGAFAPGPLHLADSSEEALPTADGVGAYKQAWLRGLAAQGFMLDEAYGNATTDVSAYAAAAIPPSSTWIIGTNGGAGGTQAVTGSWEARAAAVAAMPAVAQPFTSPAG
jgi:hypothetical protein